jgi:putative sigma-54 modulation protein
MNVEYTGRHYEVTAANRKDVETGLTKIRKILRDKFESKVVLAVEKHRHKAEITITCRIGPLVGLAQAGDMTAAISEALEHLEKQAVRHKARRITKKRQMEWPREARTGSGRSCGCRVCISVGSHGCAQVSGRGEVNRSAPGPLG